MAYYIRRSTVVRLTYNVALMLLCSLSPHVHSPQKAAGQLSQARCHLQYDLVLLLE